MSWASNEDTSRWASSWAIIVLVFCSTISTAIGAFGPPPRWLILTDELDLRRGEFGGTPRW